MEPKVKWKFVLALAIWTGMKSIPGHWTEHLWLIDSELIRGLISFKNVSSAIKTNVKRRVKKHWYHAVHLPSHSIPSSCS
jgi:hypothetical protein